MSKHSDRALELFKQGYNCSQAVFCAFCDEFNMDEETALRVSAGLGGGVGRMREVCGTVTGAALVIGMLYGATDGKDTQKKKETYEKVQEIADSVERELRMNGESEVESSRIGELVMQHLEETDQIAYVRFASVYRQFADVKNFMQELERIMHKGQQDK